MFELFYMNFDGVEVERVKQDHPLVELFDNIIYHEKLSMRGGIIAAYMQQENGESAFMFDDMFIELSHKAQLFVILHELGHMKCRHIYDGDSINVDYKRNIAHENEADMFAFERIGAEATVAAMEEVMSVVPTITSNRILQLLIRISNFELKKRIRLVKKASRNKNKKEVLV